MAKRGERRSWSGASVQYDPAKVRKPREYRETEELNRVFGFIRERGRFDARWRPWWHCPNELLGYIRPSCRQYWTKAGVVSGVSDIIGDLPVQPYHGARFELKEGEGKPLPEQLTYLQNCRDLGLAAEWCRGYWDMSLLIAAYIEGHYKPTPDLTQPWQREPIP